MTTRARCVLEFAGRCLLLMTLVGCGAKGPERVSVTGRVTIDGQPLEKGMISFSPVSGGPSGAGRIVKGAYEIPAADGPGVGGNIVRIQGFRPGKPIETKTEEVRQTEGRPTAGPSLKVQSVPDEQYLPEKYNADTILKATLNSGQNSAVDFSLASKKDEPTKPATSAGAEKSD